MRFATHLRDYADLTRPRIVGMVLLAMLVAAMVSGRDLPGRRIAHALAGTGLVIVGAIALNQRLERWTDSRMTRTAPRPLPSGRLTTGQVTAFGLATSTAGLVYLAALGNGWLLGLALVSWALYVLVYTPLKSRSAWQTPVGAIAGAMPVLLGAAAAGVPWSTTGLVLFGVVFFWQFPHAMAIAWLYREEFRQAGLRLPTVTDPSGRRASRVALAGATALLPVSLGPAFFAGFGTVYAIAATGAGLGYLAAAAQFRIRTDDRSARRLLRVSLVYLLVLFAALAWARWPGPVELS
jgi:protoheme IX farnesyltransferase